MREKPPPHVVFLDRDGVINRDSPDFIKSWSEFEFLPGSLQALVELTRAGFEIILITNQSAVNRGLISEANLHRLHDRMREAVASRGGRIRDIFFCPHLPEERCSCRKPLPGMIERACRKYRLDPQTTTMVGDSAKDILCAQNAGCGRAVLVQTGNGRAALRQLEAQNVPVAYVAENLADAAEWIISGSAGQTER